jgi:hypothetical protein
MGDKMGKYKSILYYYEKACAENENYKNDYEVVNFNNENDEITLKHIKCGCIFTKQKRLYRLSPNCINSLCAHKLRKQTNLEKYGVECISQSKEIREKINKTNLKRYGSEYPLQNKDILKKYEETNFKKYGVKNVSQNKEVREKAEATNIIKYGVKNVSQNIEIIAKRKETFINNFGVDNPLKNKEIYNKMKNTVIKKYGVDNINKYKPAIKKRVDGICNDFYDEIILNFKEIEPLFSRDEYFGVRGEKNNYYKFRCKKCGNEFEDFLATGKTPRCKKCYPLVTGSSEAEQQIQKWLSTIINIIENKRFFIDDNKYKYELDIFIPEISF